VLDSAPVERTWGEIELTDMEGNAVPYQRYSVTLPDGTVRDGTLDRKDLARFEQLVPGTVLVLAVAASVLAVSAQFVAVRIGLRACSLSHEEAHLGVHDREGNPVVFIDRRARLKLHAAGHLRGVEVTLLLAPEIKWARCLHRRRRRSSRCLSRGLSQRGACETPTIRFCRSQARGRA
jgi:hypothetical protein